MGRAPSRRGNAGAEDIEINEAFGLYPNGRPCFFCGETLRDALDDHTVYWHGYGGTAFLHPACAVRLGCHLIKDGMTAGLGGAPGDHGDGR